MMPSNSSRKKAARQHAARHDEPYTRALRATTSIKTSPDGLGSPGEAEWARDLDRIRTVQHLVQAHGWAIAAGAREEFDDDGRAATMDACWDYPTTFTPSAAAAGAHSDVLPDDLEDEYPKEPECNVAWDAELGLVVRIQTAGNWGGCPRHRTDQHTVPINEAIHLRLPRLLAAVERAAQAADPALLLDCTLHGPCGQLAAERVAHRDRVETWTGEMVQAVEGFSPEKMAELQAWEDEHLGRPIGAEEDSLGTSDWPGWIPLIGPPPWQSSRAFEDPDPSAVPVPSPDNDGVPIDLLRPVLDHRDLSLGARGIWAMLVSYYWSCEDDRTINQLREHRPQDAAETDEQLAELSTAGMITVSADGVVSIDPDWLGVLAPPPGLTE